jgi:hypothetical protein
VAGRDVAFSTSSSLTPKQLARASQEATRTVNINTHELGKFQFRGKE